MTEFGEADSSASAVRAFWASKNAEREDCIRYVNGDHYTDEEKRLLRETGRVPVVLNPFNSSLRTVVGTFLTHMYDAEFSPVGPEDTKISDVLEKLAIHEGNNNNDLMEDAQVAIMAWIGADGVRFFRPEVGPFQKPFISASTINPFAWFWDPNSKIPVTRKDAQFVDSYLWLTVNQILEFFPDAKARMSDSVLRQSGTLGDRGYTSFNRSTDRGHENSTQRNNAYLVIERYYKVRKPATFELDDADNWVEVQQPSGQRPTCQTTQEYLYVAQWAPAVMADRSFLYNGPWHAQPRDPVTQKIMWPGVELVASSINGESKGFVADLRAPAKLIDVLMTAYVEGAKHAPAGYEMDPSAFESDEEAKRASRLGAMANQRYRMKQGQAGNGFRPIPKTQSTTNDHDKAIDIAKKNFEEQSSTPPAMQGWSSEDKPSGVLNQQRIDQSFTQLMEFITYFKEYRKQILRLRYAYQREFYTDEMVFRITSPGNKSEIVSINQEQQATDEFGRPIPGQTSRINDISAGAYDVTLVDSTKSPTFRAKQQAMIQQIISSGLAAQDPELNAKLLQYWVSVSDSPEDIKQMFADYAAKKEQDATATSQMDQVGKMQQLAQNEATQTHVPMGGETESSAPIARPKKFQINDSVAQVTP